MRHYLRQEPDAVIPHVRIYEGGGLQGPSLPRQNVEAGIIEVLGGKTGRIDDGEARVVAVNEERFLPILWMKLLLHNAYIQFMAARINPNRNNFVFLDISTSEWISEQRTGQVIFLHKEWLKLVNSRIIGIYFHDITFVNDFQAPDLSDADFRMVDTDCVT
jgi:hypothetical protein